MLFPISVRILGILHEGNRPAGLLGEVWEDRGVEIDLVRAWEHWPTDVAERLEACDGLLVLGGAPKVGKSDFLISWLVHMAAGVPFLGLTPPRPLRVFYLQAEIQYHYLRERMQQIALPAAVIAAARGWLGTPYHDQASVRGVGCDCLGLLRGVWRDLYGAEPEEAP